MRVLNTLFPFSLFLNTRVLFTTTAMGDKKEEGRRSILGNLGDVFIPRSRSSSPKPGNNPAPARFDLSKCQFHETVTISFVLFISYTIQQIKHTFFSHPNTQIQC